MALFTLGNLLAWRAPGYAPLVLARVMTGLAHGVFFSIGSTLATSLVPREKAASAIAIMFTGLTVALVTGVPLGTFIGQHFGWRETFLAVAGLGVIAFVGSLVFVPRDIAHAPPTSLARQLQVLAQPRLLMVYAKTAIGYGGSFIPFTFLAPILQDVAGFSAGRWLGDAGVRRVGGGGEPLGGRLADRKGRSRRCRSSSRCSRRCCSPSRSPRGIRGRRWRRCCCGARWRSAMCRGCRPTWSSRRSASRRRPWTWRRA